MPAQYGMRDSDYFIMGASERYNDLGMPKGYRITLNTPHRFPDGGYLGTVTMYLHKVVERRSFFRKRLKGYTYEVVREKIVASSVINLNEAVCDAVYRMWKFDIESAQELQSRRDPGKL